MEIKILALIWILLDFIGFLLMIFRNDVRQYEIEFNFVMTRGTIYHKITYILFALLILPFSIVYSIKNIFTKIN
jgi:hypothetical protein